MKRPLWLSQILCEDDANSIVCPVRAGGLAGFVVLCGFQGYTTFTTHTFDATTFGAGLAALLAAVGAGAGIKAKMGA